VAFQKLCVSARIPGSSSIIMTAAVVCLTNKVNVPFEMSDLLRMSFMDRVRFSI
jgi:hypothetical protein